MQTPRLHVAIYGLNATLLIVHEIDSAYWQEWTLFHLPGGSQLFVGVHLPLVALVLWGLILMDRDSDASRWFALLLGASGLIGGLVHSWFLVSGDERFATVFSIALIAAFGTASCVQLVTTIVWWTATPKGGTASSVDH